MTRLNLLVGFQQVFLTGHFAFVLTFGGMTILLFIEPNVPRRGVLAQAEYILKTMKSICRRLPVGKTVHNLGPNLALRMGKLLEYRMNAYRWTRVVLTLWVAALTLTGCSFLLDSQETSVDEAGDTGEGVVEDTSEQPKEEPITVENAVPKVYAVQAEGESLRTIIAQFDRAMVNPSEVGKP